MLKPPANDQPASPNRTPITDPSPGQAPRSFDEVEAAVKAIRPDARNRAKDRVNRHIRSLRLTGVESAVFGHILDGIRWDRGSCYESLQAIAAALGFDDDTKPVRRAIKSIEQRGLIIVRRHKDAARKHRANEFCVPGLVSESLSTDVAGLGSPETLGVGTTEPLGLGSEMPLGLGSPEPPHLLSIPPEKDSPPTPSLEGDAPATAGAGSGDQLSLPVGSPASETPKSKRKRSAKHSKPPAPTDAEVAAFRAAYPGKFSTQRDLDAFAKLTPDDRATATKAAEKYARDCRRRDQKHVRYASNWLNDGDWKTIDVASPADDDIARSKAENDEMWERETQIRQQELRTR